MLQTIFNDFRNGVRLIFPVPFEWTVEDTSTHVVTWLRSSDCNFDFSVTGLLSTLDFSNMLGTHVGSHLATCVRIMVYMSSAIYSYGLGPDAAELWFEPEPLQAVIEEIMTELDKLLTPREIAAMSLTKRYSVFLLLLAVSLAGSYAVTALSEVASEGLKPRVCPDTGNEMLRVLGHYFLLLGHESGLLREKNSNDEVLFGQVSKQWNKPSNFRWFPQDDENSQCTDTTSECSSDWYPDNVEPLGADSEMSVLALGNMTLPDPPAAVANVHSVYEDWNGKTHDLSDTFNRVSYVSRTGVCCPEGLTSTRGDEHYQSGASGFVSDRDPQSSISSCPTRKEGGSPVAAETDASSLDSELTEPSPVGNAQDHHSTNASVPCSTVGTLIRDDFGFFDPFSWESLMQDLSSTDASLPSLGKTECGCEAALGCTCTSSSNLSPSPPSNLDWDFMASEWISFFHEDLTLPPELLEDTPSLTAENAPQAVVSTEAILEKNVAESCLRSKDIEEHHHAFSRGSPEGLQTQATGGIRTNHEISHHAVDEFDNSFPRIYSYSSRKSHITCRPSRKIHDNSLPDRNSIPSWEPGLKAHNHEAEQALHTYPDADADLASGWTSEELAELLSPGFRSMHERHDRSLCVCGTDRTVRLLV